jgi:hypothetical protein
VNVSVDHARRNDESGGVDAHSRFAASGAADSNDAVALQPDIAEESQIAGTIDHLAAMNQDVEHINTRRV